MPPIALVSTCIRFAIWALCISGILAGISGMAFTIAAGSAFQANVAVLDS
jgi:hypothetical protein